MADLATSGLSKAHRELLLVAGFQTASEVAEMGAVALMKELHCSKDDAAAILVGVGGAAAEPAAAAASGSGGAAVSGSGVAAATAFELLTATPRKHIVTFCKPLDDLLGGIPGVGKTQLCMQIAADAAVPKGLGGVGGGALYIDTEGSFMVTRQQGIAAALATHLASMAGKRARSEGGGASVPDTPDARSIMSGLHVLRATSAVEQQAAVLALPALLDELPHVRCVVLDSIAFHFRHTGGDGAARAARVRSMGAALQSVAASHGVAVVVTNHMTHRRLPGSDDFALVPALGEGWAHISANRVLLTWTGALRSASLVKSATRAPGSCLYSVTAEGIRRVRSGS